MIPVPDISEDSFSSCETQTEKCLAETNLALWAIVERLDLLIATTRQNESE